MGLARNACVVLLEKPLALEGILSQKIFSSYSYRWYLSLDNLSGEQKQRLQSAGFTEAVSSGEMLSREKFLSEYIELVGTLSQQFASRAWWAMDISSKNRFASPLPSLLSAFLRAAQAVKEVEGDLLLIVNVPPEILQSLQAVIAGQGLQCRSFPSSLVKQRTWRWENAVCLCLSGMFHALRIAGRAVYARRHLSRNFSEKCPSPHTAYVIRSFVYEHSFDRQGVYQDAFFGILPQHLQKKHQVMVLADVLGPFAKCVEKMKTSDMPVYPWEMFLSWRDWLTDVFLFLIRPRFQFQGQLPFAGHDVTALVNNALRSNGWKVQIYQFFQYRAVKRLAQRVLPARFLLVYENNPWEKMSIMALRGSSPRTIIKGYYHTLIFQASANMFVGKAEAQIIPRPDVLLIIGPKVKQVIERYGHFAGRVVETCGLKFDRLFEKDVAAKKEGATKTILLALEGIFDVYQMVNYALLQLQGQREYQLIIRCHPVLSLERLRVQLIEDPAVLPYVEVSRGKLLQEDIERSDVMMYWGSAVAVDALWMGKPVVHFDLQTALSFDPLEDCQHWHWRVTKEDRLLPLLEKILNVDESQRKILQNRAREYLKSYVNPVREEYLREFE